MAATPAARQSACPACRTAPLEPADLEPGLPSLGCPRCAGSFIALESYLAWQRARPETAAGSAGPVPSPAPDSRGAKLCPSCGHFMTRFRIADAVPFHIDRCGGCAGMWFDAGEWAVLRSQGLHTRLHTLFSDAHQHQLRAHLSAQQHEERLRSLLGEESFARARDFKLWLSSHPQQQILRAYLDDRPAP